MYEGVYMSRGGGWGEGRGKGTLSILYFSRKSHVPFALITDSVTVASTLYPNGLTWCTVTIA